MNRNLKTLLTICLLVITLAFVSGCAPEQTPYELNDSENFNVSVKYDAGEGIFTTNTSVIVDSYNISQMGADSQGKVNIALIAPDDSARANDAFSAVNNGHFLAGWYSQRTETQDAAGNTVYTYSGKWDFANDMLAVDAAGTYTSAQPVLTLYAAWIPLFEVEFCDLATGEALGKYTFNPLTAGEITVPQWNAETGAIEMYDFPKRSGYTFTGAYYDAAGTQMVAETVQHPGVVDEATGSAQNGSMKLYVDWTEGDWYHIYTVEQFLDHASVNGSYVLHADLDFEGEIWPTSLMYGNFTGTIEGNSHTMKNITLAQTNTSKVNAGLFGHIAEGAAISDLNLDNVTFTIQSGTRVAGTSYGLVAGSVSGEAELANVTVANSTLQIDSKCYFGTDDYAIGLVCGMGTTDIDYSGITAAATGTNPENVVITVNGDVVTVEIVS